MDELKGKPIPNKAPLFGRKEAKPAPFGGEQKLVETFANEDGTKAVNLLMVEETEEDTAKKLTRAGLESYAEELMNGGEDTRDLMVGSVFNGEDAEKKARETAARIDDELNPGADATDDELLDAAEEAKGGEQKAPELPEKKPAPVGGLGGENASPAAGLPKPSFGNFAKEPEKKKTPEDLENEPMMKQLGGNK